MALINNSNTRLQHENNSNVKLKPQRLIQIILHFTIIM